MPSTVGLHVDTANAICNVFRHVAYDVTACYIQLHYGIPGADGDEYISDADPALKLVSFEAAVNGGINIAASPIWTNDNHTETLTHISVWDGPDGPGTDEPLWSAQLTTPQNWADGDSYTLDNCGLVFTPLMTSEGS